MAAILFRDGIADSTLAKSLLCTSLLATWIVSDAETLNEALVAADEARDQGLWVVFALNYELGVFFEPTVTLQANHDPNSSIGYVWIFQTGSWLTAEEADSRLLEGKDISPSLCVRERASLDKQSYVEEVQHIKSAIAEGEIYQANFTFQLPIAVVGDPAVLFVKLAKAQPTSQAVFIHLPECCVLSLSPELFFAVNNDEIVVRPMKGTALRSEDPIEDQRHAETLRASEKNRAENLMIVDLLRNDLGRITLPGSVAVDSLFDIESYPTVHQMTSSVRGLLRTAKLRDLLPALFPCGSVTGAPKVAAMRKIVMHENRPRGLYTGSIGWAQKERIFANVAIRTLVLDTTTASDPSQENIYNGLLGVGSGIVWDSDPEEEYAECLLKSAFLTRPDPGFTLFETLLLEMPAAELEATLPLIEIFPRYRQHYARMEASAFAMGFVFERASFEKILWQVKAEVRQKSQAVARAKSYRVRVDLAHNGVFKSSWSLLPPLAERVGLIWATERLNSRNPLLRHKISARAIYDAAIETAMAQKAFDALFCNEAGYVCEGARSNVFVREGNRLLTPPLRCGLLPGVMRSALIASGQASESLLTVADVKAASREGRLRVGNALRGLVPAYLQ